MTRHITTDRDAIPALNIVGALIYLVALLLTGQHALSQGTGPIVNDPGIGPIGDGFETDLGLLLSCTSGSVPDQLSVNNNGVLNYEVPIMAPPGVKSMTPKIGISYSSTSGNGQLGMGWSLSGLSRITRCGANMIQDQRVSGVNFDSNDRFCLDGVKLIAVKGVYGQDGTEYRTDPDQFSRIISYGNDGYGPLYFKVWNRSGQIIEYGGNADSSEGRIERVIFDPFSPTMPVQLKGVREWAISKISDRQSNSIDFFWGEDNTITTSLPTGEHWIKEIRYAKDPTTDKYNKLLFEYIQHVIAPETIPQYQVGGLIHVRSRLTKISTFTQNELTNEYSISYAANDSIDTPRAIVTDITNCDNRGVCLSNHYIVNPSSAPQLHPTATLFINGADANLLVGSGFEGFLWETKAAPTLGGAYRTVAHAEYGANTRLGADVNNDGRSDLIIIKREGAHAVAKTYSFDLHTQVLGQFLVNESLLGLWGDGSNRYMTGDVTGDGRTDIIIITYDVFSNFSYATVYAVQGRDDFFSFLSSSPIFAGAHGTINDTLIYFQTVNLDNDGKDDLIGFKDKPGTGGSSVPRREAHAFRSTGTGFEEYNLNLQYFPGEPKSLGDFQPFPFVREFVADVNGDSLTDIVFVAPGGLVEVNVFLGTPSEAMKFTKSTPSGVSVVAGVGEYNGNIDNYYIFPMDVNGDANDDIVIFTERVEDTYVYVYLSTGAGTAFHQLSPGFPQKIVEDWLPQFHRFVPGDYNGDGRSDFLLIVDKIGEARTEIWTSNGKQLAAEGVFKKTLNVASSLVGAEPDDPPFYTPDEPVYIPLDVNGDGKADIVRVGGSVGGAEFDYFEFAKGKFGHAYFSDIKVAGARIDTYLSPQDFGDLLRVIVDGNTHVTNITYKPMTDPKAYHGHTSLESLDPLARHFQSPQPVVVSTAESNGIGGFYYRDFAYEGSKLHPSFGFLGVSKQSISDRQTGLCKHTSMLQDFPRIGLVASETVDQLSVPPLKLKTNYWSWVVSESNVNIVQLIETLTEEWDLDSTKTKTELEEWTYGDYGTVIYYQKRWNNAFLPNAPYMKLVETDYDIDEEAWLINRPVKVTTTASAPDHEDLTRTQHFQYHRSTDLVETREEIWGDFPTEAFLASTYYYDNFGNLNKTVTTGSDFADTRETSVTMERVGRFVVTSTNQLGQVTDYIYDPRFGTPISITGPDGLETRWTYDGFGRKVNQTDPDKTSSTTSYCQVPLGSDETPQFSVRREITVTPGLPTKTDYFDNLGRLLRRTSEGFNGQKIFVDTAYDSVLRVQMQSRPYFSTDPMPASTFTYDILGRVVEEVRPNNSIVELSYQSSVSALPSIIPLGPDHGSLVGVTIKEGPRQESQLIYNELGQVVQSQNRDQNGTLLGLTTFAYDSFGHRSATASGAPIGFQTKITYLNDVFGRVLAQTDPDLGHSTYAYNALGELISASDPLGTTTFEYDKLGRMIQRVEAERISNWCYDDLQCGVPVPHAAIGKLISRTTSTGFSETYGYDDLGRVVDKNTYINEEVFTTSFTYGPNSRVESHAYPGDQGFKVKNIYNGRGFLTEVRNYTSGELYWKALELSAIDQPAKVVLGNGVDNNTYFDLLSNITNIDSYKNGNLILWLWYNYDANNNLTFRGDVGKNRGEVFAYDAMNRLKSAYVLDMQNISPPLSSVMYMYDLRGNIVFKSDVGSYVYNNITAGPHAVTSIGNYAFDYDDAGNMLSGFGTEYHWNSFKKPQQILFESGSATLSYDDQYSKYATERNGDFGNILTYYIGTDYEREVDLTTSDIIHRHYITAGDLPIAMYTTSSVGSTSLVYYLRDNLGSPASILDETGSVIEEQSYDPYGRRRESHWESGENFYPQLDYKRGFTGHEHLDEAQVIDMKGRLYNPRIGRFLSPDPFIPDQVWSQAYNRYSYVYDSPLNYVDSTGFMPEDDETNGFELEPVEIVGKAPEWMRPQYIDLESLEALDSVVTQRKLAYERGRKHAEEAFGTWDVKFYPGVGWQRRILPTGALNVDNTLAAPAIQAVMAVGAGAEGVYDLATGAGTAGSVLDVGMAIALRKSLKSVPGYSPSEIMEGALEEAGSSVAHTYLDKIKIFPDNDTVTSVQQSNRYNLVAPRDNTSTAGVRPVVVPIQRPFIFIPPKASELIPYKR